LPYCHKKDRMTGFIDEAMIIQFNKVFPDPIMYTIF
jgi:hypothetical protein